MAEPAKTEEKASTGKAPKRAPRQKKISQGESLVCDVCGLSVVVEEIGDLEVREESVLLCCGQPMKEAKRAKTAKKA